MTKHQDSGVPIHDLAFTPPPAEPQASAARRPQPPVPAEAQRRRRMATVETLEGRTIPSNVVTSFTHDAITGAV